MTKKELQERVDVLGSLLFEAVHLLRQHGTMIHASVYEEEELEEQVNTFLYKCQKEGIV